MVIPLFRLKNLTFILFLDIFQKPSFSTQCHSTVLNCSYWLKKYQWACWKQLHYYENDVHIVDNHSKWYSSPYHIPKLFCLLKYIDILFDDWENPCRTMIWFEFSFSKLVWPLTVFCMSENQIRSLPCSLFTEFKFFLGFFDVIFERFWMFVSLKLSSATSMLVTAGGDEICWRQLWRRFRHQHPLSFNIGVGYPQCGSHIQKIKPIAKLCHQHKVTIIDVSPTSM